MAFKDNAVELEERVVAINRVTKVVKGGRNMRFAALVVVGAAHRCPSRRIEIQNSVHASLYAVIPIICTTPRTTSYHARSAS